MKFTASLIFVLALGLAGFGCGGLFTEAGSRRYDEMSGMYPFFALVAAGALTMVAAGLFAASALRVGKSCGAGGPAVPTDKH